MNKRLITVFKIVFFNTILISVPLFSQSNVTLIGTVIDATTQKELPYANVFLEGTSLGSSTDLDGYFRISDIPPGTYTLRVVYIGYKQQEEEISVEADKALVFNFELEPEFIEGEEIVVTAQAEGQKRAINEQLSSMMIKNVVSAARIRELPDANAAESVARLPGVTIQREGGEGAKVVIRGLSPQYNRVTIDGVELPANVTSTSLDDHDVGRGSIPISGDRASNLSMISSSMLGGIEVIKAITPDLDATGIGGVVNFTMRKARNDKPQFGFSAQGSHNVLRDSYNDFKTIGSYEQRYLNGSLGLFAQGSIEQKNLGANELSAPYYGEGTYYEHTPIVILEELSINDVTRDRERYGASIVLDYLWDGGSIGFMNFYSSSNTDVINRTELFDWAKDNSSINYNTKHEYSELDVFSNLISVKQDFSGFHLDLKLSHSFSRSQNPEDVNFNFIQSKTFGSDTTGFEPFIDTYFTDQDAKKVASYAVHDAETAIIAQIYNVSVKSEDRTYNVGLDLTKYFTFTKDISAIFKIGGTYQNRDRSYNYDQGSGDLRWGEGEQLTAELLNQYPEFGESITLSDFIDEGHEYDKFLNGDYTFGPALNVDQMLDVMEVVKEHPSTGGGGYQFRPLPSYLNDYEGEEEKSAVYGMTTIKLGQMFTIIPGARYQNLTTTYNGFGVLQTSGSGGSQYIELKKTRSHGYLLPMAHLRFKPINWFQLHFAYTNTLNYPDYNTIIPRYYIGFNFVLYNNFDLKPARSENFDLVASFYSNEIGLFAIGGFKKKISDLVFPSISYPTDWSDYPEVEEALEDDPALHSLNTYINSPIDIDVWGMETEWQTNFWYLPGALSGLVLGANYTHIFSEAEYPKTFFLSYPPSAETNWLPVVDTVNTTYKSRLLDQPDDVFNLYLGYDYQGFSLRFSVLYKDNIFKKPDFWEVNWVHSDKFTRLDLSAKQRLPWYNTQLYLNINNITGEDDADIVPVYGNVTYQQRYGRTVDIGLNIMF